MKKLIGTLLLLQLSVILFAQSSLSIKRIDELIKVGYAIKTKNIDSVLLLANLTLHQSQLLQYKLGITKAKTLASFYYLDKYKYDTAKFLLNESLQFFTQFSKYQNSLDHGMVFLHLGYIAVKEYEFELATRYANNALNIFKMQEQIEYVPPALILLGGIESSLGNYAKGLAYYSNALRLKIDHAYPEEKCISDFSNIGAIYMKIGQHGKAIQYLRKALKLSTQYNHIERQLINLINLGSSYSFLKNYDSSLYFYGECIRISNLHDKVDKKQIALYNMANLYSKQDQYKKSNEVIKEILVAKPGIDVHRNAQILLAKNLFYLGKIDSSLIIARKLYKTFYKYSRNKESTAELTNVLAMAYQKKKKYDSALFYLNLSHLINDSIYNQQNQSTLSILYAELENLEKEKEIEILQKERLVQKENQAGILIILISSTLIIVLISVSIILVFRNKEKNEKIKSTELKRLLEKKKRDLHQQTLKIIYMNNGLIEIENNLRRLQIQIENNRSKDIEIILETIRNSQNLETEWENFMAYFDQVYDQFTQKVDNRFPNLSTSEKRLILLIKMELKNREIASILNIDAASVKMAKYRLKKKLQLPEEIDVQLYLYNFN